MCGRKACWSQAWKPDFLHLNSLKPFGLWWKIFCLSFFSSLECAWWKNEIFVRVKWRCDVKCLRQFLAHPPCRLAISAWAVWELLVVNASGSCSQRMCSVVSSPRAPKDKALSLRWWISQCTLGGKGRKTPCCLQLAATSWGWGRRRGNVFLLFPTSILTHFLTNVCLQHVRDPTKTCGQLRGTLGSGRPHVATVGSAQLQEGLRVPFLFLPCQPLQNKVLFGLVYGILIPPLTVFGPWEIRFCFSVCQNPGFFPDFRTKVSAQSPHRASFGSVSSPASCSGSSFSSHFHSFPQSSFAPSSLYHHSLCRPKFSPDQNMASYENYIDNNLPASHHFHVVKLLLLTQFKIFINPSITKEEQTMF